MSESGHLFYHFGEEQGSVIGTSFLVYKHPVKYIIDINAIFIAKMEL